MYAILLIPTSRRYPGQLFYGQNPDIALLEPFRSSHTIRTTCPQKLRCNHAGSYRRVARLALDNHQPIGYVGDTTIQEMLAAGGGHTRYLLCE